MSERRRRGWWLGIAVPCAVLLVACEKDAEPAPHDHPVGGGSAEPAAVPCTPLSRTFSAGPAGIGVVAMGAMGTMSARVIDAAPKSPKRFENDWTVAFLDAQGQPLNDVQITGACAYMPAHNHREPPQAIIPQSDPSTFLLKAVNLSMRGPWEVEIAIKSPTLGGAATKITRCDSGASALGSDLVVINACIEDQ